MLIVTESFRPSDLIVNGSLATVARRRSATPAAIADIGLGHDNDKLVTRTLSASGDEIDTADAVGRSRREFAQYVISGGMTVGIVDLLEVVDVEQHRRLR